jgi:hypothetical protein
MPSDRDPIPTSRLSRLSRIGRLAAGQAARQAGTRAANVVRDDEASQAALERRQIEAAEQIVTVLGTMKGAAMKLGQVLSFLDVGLVPESYREEFQAKLAELRDAAPKVSFKDMRRVLEGEYGEKLDDVFATFDPVPIAAASIGQVYKAACTTTATSREGPVPRRGRRRPRRHAEPRADPADHEARRPGARPGRDRGGDPLAHPRGARLRARGGKPARARADLPRPPVHRRARGGHGPLAREGRRLRVRLGARVRRAQAAAAGRARPPRGDRLPLLLRVHVPRARSSRRPAPGQLAAARRRPHGVPGLRPVQAHREGVRDTELRIGQAGIEGDGEALLRELSARASSATPTAGTRRSCSSSSRADVVVHAGRRGRAHAGDRHPGAHRHERPAVALVQPHAPRERPADHLFGRASRR